MVLEAAGSAATLVVRAHLLEALRAVGRSCRIAVFFSMKRFGEEEPAAMMVSDSQQDGRLVRCLYAAGSVPEAGLSFQSEIERKAQSTRPNGRLSSLGGASKWARRRVCTLCAPWAWDRFVLVPGWAGLRRFRGSSRI